MPEPLTTELLSDLLKDLSANWPRHISGDASRQVAVYRSGLGGLSGDAVRAAVKRSIQEDEYFPKVGRLRELAHAWTKRNTSDTLGGVRDELWCGRCQSRVRARDRWRPVTDPTQQHAPLLTADGAYLLLEPYQRDLCDCAAPCAYEPLPDIDPPAMAAQKAPPAIQARAIKSTTTPREANVA
jgi:hypothetical protein